MQRLDMQFYAFFTIVLCGAVLGLLFDFLRVVVRRCRLGLVASAAADLLFWAVATVALSGALFYGNWGELRLYVLVGLLIGIGAYEWLASPVISTVFDVVLSFVAWLLRTIEWLIRKLVWDPLLALIHFLVIVATVIEQTLWRILCWVGRGAWRPLRGPSRWVKLQYLLTKRKWRRHSRRKR